jgi:hypothetical protein
MLSVYTHHHSDCKNADDKTWRRCGCPKWIWDHSTANSFARALGPTVGKRLKAFAVNSARDLCRPVAAYSARPGHCCHTGTAANCRSRTAEKAAGNGGGCGQSLPSRRDKPRCGASHPTKLTTIFRKQFLAWTRIEGIEYLDELELDTLLNFRNTWEDVPLAKQKKQSRVIGFFWACVRRRYLTENPAIGLGKIKVVQIPTDYFPPDEFDGAIAEAEM